MAQKEASINNNKVVAHGGASNLLIKRSIEFKEVPSKDQIDNTNQKVHISRRKQNRSTVRKHISKRKKTFLCGNAWIQ
jgi:hypothetical protein